MRTSHNFHLKNEDKVVAKRAEIGSIDTGSNNAMRVMVEDEDGNYFSIFMSEEKMKSIVAAMKGAL